MSFFSEANISILGYHCRCEIFRLQWPRPCHPQVLDLWTMRSKETTHHPPAGIVNAFLNTLRLP